MRRRRRSLGSPVVTRSGNSIVFLGKVNAKAHREYLWRLADCRALGYQDVVLDFSKCEAAFPNGMILRVSPW
jgi:hypothetical protein